MTFIFITWLSLCFMFLFGLTLKTYISQSRFPYSTYSAPCPWLHLNSEGLAQGPGILGSAGPAWAWRPLWCAAHIGTSPHISTGAHFLLWPLVPWSVPSLSVILTSRSVQSATVSLQDPDLDQYPLCLVVPHLPWARCYSRTQRGQAPGSQAGSWMWTHSEGSEFSPRLGPLPLT